MITHLKQLISQITNNFAARYVAGYTVLFALIFTAGNSLFIFGDYTFLHNSDTLVQHYPALVYFGEYLRALPGHIANGNLPMYDFSIGLGDDIFATLITHSANIEIFNIPFVFVSRENAHAAYVFSVIARVYFAGLTFSYFCFSVAPALKQKKSIALLGALVYVFSGWAYVYILRQPSFMIALLYLPLIAAGIDKALRDKKPYLFIISVFLLGLASFYFLYMATLFIAAYAIIRLHHLYKNKQYKSQSEGFVSYIKILLRYGIKSIGFYLIGLAMAAVTFIPLVTAHLSSGRAPHIITDSLLHYSATDYLSSFASFPAPSIIGRVWSFSNLGLSAIVPLMLIVLFFQKPVKKHLIIAVATTFVVSNIPFVSFALGGFSYLTNRVEFIYNFVYCAAFVIALRDFAPLCKKAAIALLCYAAALLAAIIVIIATGDDEFFFLRVGFGFVALFIAVMLAPVNNRTFRLINPTNRHLLIYALTVINLIVNVVAFNMFGDFSFVRKGAPDIHSDYVSVSDYVDDSSFYRQSSPFTMTGLDYTPKSFTNSSMLLGYYGVAQYWSLGNTAYADFSFELENSEQALYKWRIDSLDSRTALQQLASVKYIFISGGAIPYGYEEIAQPIFRRLYVNKYALPLGYTYSKAISAGEYEKLHPLDKQDALMQAVALDGEYANASISSLSLEKKPIPYTANAENGLKWENGILDNTGVNAIKEESFSDDFDEGVLRLELDSVGVCGGNCETYARVVGYNSVDLETPRADIAIKVPEMDVQNEYIVTTRSINQFHGRENHLINLGYFEKPITQVELRFTKGVFTLAGIEVWCVPMDSYPERAEALRINALENIELGINTVTGNITLHEDKFLVLSIPYSRGWSASVNDEPAELLQANTAFMAIPLPAGEHEIALTYETPNLRLGAILSLVGFITFVVIIISRRQ